MNVGIQKFPQSLRDLGVNSTRIHNESDHVPGTVGQREGPLSEEAGFSESGACGTKT